MGLLDQAQEFVGSDEGKSMMNKMREQGGQKFGLGGSQEDSGFGSGMGRQSNQSRNDESMLGDNDYQKNNDDVSSRSHQSSGLNNEDGYSARSNQSSGLNTEDGYSSRSNQMGSNNENEYSSRSDDAMGARSGVSSGGVNDNYQSVGSGGYGTNDQGDSFSRNNQSGFNNEDLNSSSGTY